MALRDRTFYTRRMAGHAAEPAPTAPVTVVPSAHADMPLPSADIRPVSFDHRAPSVERPAAGDRPRSLLSRAATEVKYKIHDRLMRELDPTRLTSDLSPEEARRAVEDAVEQLIELEGPDLSRADELTIMREAADEIVGYGPIEPLLNDDTITEVMVNRPDRVFYERGGVLHLSDRVFRDDDHVMRLIDKIVSPLGRRIDESSPMVDARLPDGSRVNAIVPPLAVHGPSLTIRKFAKRPLTE